VPAKLDAPEHSPEVSGEHSPRAEGFEAAIAAIETAHAAEIGTMRERVDDANQRADVAEAGRREAIALVEQTVSMLTDERGRADRAEAAIAGERKRADRAEQRADGLRSRLDELEVNLGAARTEAHKASEAAAALTRNEVARKARGRWARLRAAWRGE
jgi:hypothetical protein